MPVRKPLFDETAGHPTPDTLAGLPELLTDARQEALAVLAAGENRRTRGEAATPTR